MQNNTTAKRWHSRRRWYILRSVEYAQRYCEWLFKGLVDKHEMHSIFITPATTLKDVDDTRWQYQMTVSAASVHSNNAHNIYNTLLRIYLRAIDQFYDYPHNILFESWFFEILRVYFDAVAFRFIILSMCTLPGNNHWQNYMLNLCIPLLVLL